MPTPIPWTLFFRIAFLIAAAGAFVLAVMPGSTGSIEHYDKLNHALAFTVLAGLAAFGFPGRRLTTLLGGLAIFGAIIELVQGLPVVHRDCSVWDWITDSLAAAITLGFVALALRWRVGRRRDR